MGAAASFGFSAGEQPKRERKIDYNKLLALRFYDMVRCDSARQIVVTRGQRVVRCVHDKKKMSVVVGLFDSEM